MSNNQALEWALFYLSLGFWLIPVKRGDKTPLTTHGVKDASNDPEVIRRWFQDLYPGANIGIVTGEVSGITVIDIDPRNGGLESAEKLGSFPSTLTQNTGGGGFHLVYIYQPGLKNSSGKLGRGIDIKNDSGYIVATPSIHSSGALYTWDDPNQPISTFPTHILVLLNKARPREKITVSEGGRNNYLTKVAGKLRRYGASEQQLLEQLLAVNQVECNPPLDESEVASIARSISSYPSAESHYYSDLGNAQRFIEQYKDVLKFCPEAKSYFWWNGVIWERSSREKILSFAIETVKGLINELSIR